MPHLKVINLSKSYSNKRALMDCSFSATGGELIGILGANGAGKSTLISRISNARPKIADYPFTTLHPNLGVVRTSESRSFVVADIPGFYKETPQTHY